MRERVEERLATLRGELEAGMCRERLLRISGAIQVLEELLKQSAGAG